MVQPKGEAHPQFESAASPQVRRKGVAYVVKRFPRLSETFILDEIIALEKRGLSIKVISIHPTDTKVHKHFRRVRAPVFYIPESVLDDLPQMLWAQGHFFVHYPRRWIRAFGVMLFRHNPRAARHWLKAGLVARRLEGTNTGHIHAHFSTSPTAIAMMSSILLGMRYSIACHAKDVYAEGRLHSPGFFRNLMRSSFVVVVSDRTKKDILDAWPGLPHQKIHVVYNGLDLDRFQSRLSEPKSNLILSVGRMVEKKGFTYLVQSLSLLRDGDVDFKGEIVGYGSEKKGLNELISSLHLESKVRIIGPLAQDELIMHYHAASVFCLATLIASNDDRDILPNVIKEAMAVGVPVLTTEVPGMEELVEDGFNGILVPPKDPGAMARGMQELLGDGELRRRLAIAARRRIEERFDRSKNTSSLLTLLEQQLS